MTLDQMHAMVKLGSDAGRQEVLMAQHEQREPVTEYTTGLAQSVRHEITRLEIGPQDRDYAISLFHNVYTETITSCLKAIEGAW